LVTSIGKYFCEGRSPMYGIMFSHQEEFW